MRATIRFATATAGAVALASLLACTAPPNEPASSNDADQGMTPSGDRSGAAAETRFRGLDSGYDDRSDLGSGAMWNGDPLQ